LGNVRNWLYLLVAALPALAILSPGAGQLASAQEQPATLTIAPAPGAIAAGSRATFTVDVSGAQRLFGADIELTFRPGAITVTDADPAKDGVQVRIGPFLDPGFVVYNNVDNTAGKIRVTFTQVAPKAAASGAGGLLSFDVTATGGGDPGLRISAALLARDDGVALPVLLPSGSTPAAPQGSPVPNPTIIPTVAGATGQALTPTTAAAASAAPGTTTAAANSTGAGAAGDTPGDGDSGNRNVLVLTAGALIGLAVIVAAGFTLKRRNGAKQ